MARLTSLTRRFNEATLPQLYEAPPVAQPAGAQPHAGGLRQPSLCWPAGQLRAPHSRPATPRHPPIRHAHATPPGPQRKEDDCVPEKLVMFLCLSTCMNTLVLGLRQVRPAAASRTGA
jgi:hypothetical protein